MTEKKITVITLIILGVILLAGGGAIAYLKLGILEDKNKEIRQTEASIDGAQKKAQMVKPDPPPSRMEEIKEKAGKDAEDKRRRVPPFQAKSKETGLTIDREYDQLVNQLEIMRRRAGVIVTGIKYKKPARAQRSAVPVPRTIDKRTFEIICAGRFYNLLRFLYEIETNLRQINLESFTISKGNSLKLELHSFALKGAAPGGGKAPPAGKGKDDSEKKPKDAVEVGSTEFP